MQFDDRRDFLPELRIAGGHVAFQTMRLQICFSQIRAIRFLFTFIINAILRSDQCVEPSAGVCQFAPARVLAVLASTSVALAPSRNAQESPGPRS
jgi:hypothetical protein